MCTHLMSYVKTRSHYVPIVSVCLVRLSSKRDENSHVNVQRSVL